MGIIRIAIGIIIGLIVLLFLLKSNKIHKKQGLLIATVVVVLVCTLLAFIPFENAFITFPTAEKSFNYFHGKNMNVQIVLDGEVSSFVLAGDNSKHTIQLVPKTNDGWKIARGTDSKKVLHKIIDNYSVNIYRYKNSQDYFIGVVNTKSGNIEVTDNCNSKFHALGYENKALKETFYSYYARIESYDYSYCLIIDDKEIPLHKTTE